MSPFLLRLVRTPVGVGLLLALCALPLQAANTTLLVLGDSISAAYGMSLKQGWVSQLEDELQQKDPEYRVINASISGETTAGGLRRLPKLLADHEPALVIIELGGNDGLRGYPITSLRHNLETMAQLARDAGAEVLLLPMEIPPNYGPRYTRQFREAYAEAARATGSALGPFLLEGVATDDSLMQADGIHPTAAAQPLMLDNLREAIEALL